MQDMQQVGNTREPQFMCSWWWFSVSCRSLGLQQHHRGLDDISLPSLHTHSDDIQSIIHRIKSAEIALLLHNKYPERVSGDGTLNRGYVWHVVTCVCMNLSYLSDAGLCSCRNTGEAFSSPPAATGTHQAAACQCVCEFFTSLSPVMVANWIWLMLVSVLRSFLGLVKGVSGCDSVFMGISVTQPTGVTVLRVLGYIGG